MKANKFIVTKKEHKLHLGCVEFHFQLYEDEKDILGGGLFFIDKKNKKIHFYGRSTDFGVVLHDILDAVLKEQEKDIKDQIYFAGYCPAILSEDELAESELTTDVPLSLL